ncbi:uncharacterized protein LOC114247782 [Bombyx mandarina]|uniref:Uncharacterized protein LOC114247782 n=1 Tax=Bombyx mandarina TaxID=7092 RepID=A0A6J2K8L2_BOMMA|nr:uncharacterized protein LOC114247782 [Bombyx mandarina]
MDKKDRAGPSRKRGRPAGRNRVPLSLEERRNRNAQYERERRAVTAEATQQLAEAAGCSPETPTGDLLLHVVAYLHRNMQPRLGEEIADLRRRNTLLKAQIIQLENQLANLEAADNDINDQQLAAPSASLPGPSSIPEHNEPEQADTLISEESGAEMHLLGIS